MKKDQSSSNTTPRQSRSNVVRLKGEIDLHVSPTVTAALNEMIDVTTSRAVAFRTHSPLPVFLLLVLVALVGALLAGYAMGESRGRDWLHNLAFAALVSGTLYVIVDLEYPRSGLVGLETADQALLELRSSID